MVGHEIEKHIRNIHKIGEKFNPLATEEAENKPTMAKADLKPTTKKYEYKSGKIIN